MAKFRAKLTQMKSADPSYVSLVKRGANRIAFRIVKQGDETVDLTSLKRVLKQQPAQKSEPEKPEVLAFVVEKAEDMAALEKALTDAGYSVEKKAEQEDGTVAYLQSDADLSEGAVVRVSDAMVAVVKHLAVKGDFGKHMQDVEFVAGTDVACYALKSALDEAMGNGPEAVADVLDAFGDYMLSVAQAPQGIFKADAAMGTAIKAVKAAKAEADEAARKAEEDRAAEEARKAAEAGNGEGEGEAEPTVDEKITKALEESNAALATTLAESIAKALEPITATVTQLQDQIKEVAEKAEKAATAVKGTVVAAASKADDEPAKTVQKTDANGTGCFDTALARRRARTAELNR